jgi:hypothetical protein
VASCRCTELATEPDGRPDVRRQALDGQSVTARQVVAKARPSCKPAGELAFRRVAAVLAEPLDLDANRVVGLPAVPRGAAPPWPVSGSSILVASRGRA